MQDTEHQLEFGIQTAIVSPFGASLRRYSVTEGGRARDVIWGYQGGAQKRGGQGDVLIPFPGRIRDAVYTWAGARHELEKTDKDGPNAIHGFLRAKTFSSKKITATEAHFETRIEHAVGYPFKLHVEVSYALGAVGLTTRFSVTNTGADNAPVGVGFHPYFKSEGALPEWKVMIPAARYIELERLVPTGRVLAVDGTSLDFRQPRALGQTRYDDCVAKLERDADGWATMWVSNAAGERRATIRMDQNFDYVVVYTGDQIAAPDARRAFAIEPMTCAPDALNHPEWGLKILAAGERMSGAFVISAN